MTTHKALLQSKKALGSTACFSMMGHPYEYMHNMQVSLNVPPSGLIPRIYLAESEDVDSMSRIYTATNERPERAFGACESCRTGKRASLWPGLTGNLNEEQ